MNRPNVLILYTDQQRWDALGINGNEDIQTPNLDRLAREGVNFDRYFVQNPVCMPSRISFLTGQYPSTLRITHMGVPVPPETVTLPHLLRPYGYHTANIGKLHFLPHANRDHTVPHPSYGFDHLEIADEPGVYEDAYRAWVRQRAPEQLSGISAGLPPNTAIWQQVMGIDDGIGHATDVGRSDFKGPVPFGADDDLTHTAFVAEQIMDYLRNRGPQGPFLCIAGFYSPHAPWMVPQRYLDVYEPASFTLPPFPLELDAQRQAAGITDDQLRAARHGYYAMVTEVDHHVGRILNTLEETGLADNTIVIFTSDHGEWLGEHMRYGKGYPGHDAVSRVPLIIRWPNIPQHDTIHTIVEGIDIVPTLLESAAIQTPPHLQGRSLLPLIQGEDGGAFDDHGAALMEHAGWKTLRTDTHRYVLHDDGRELLFNLVDDPLGYHDIAGDSAQAKILAKHRLLLAQRLLASERPLPRTWTY